MKKIPINRKDDTWVLISDNKIIWLVGHRIDDSYKITEDTQQVLVIKSCEN